MADLPASKQQRLQGLNQDVLAVAAPELPPTLKPIEGEDANPGRQRTMTARRDWRLWVALALALIALILCFVLWSRLAALQAELEQTRLREDRLAADVGELARRMTAADSDVAKMDGSAQSNLLQLNNRVRALAVGLARVNKQKDDSELEAKVSALDSRLQSLANDLAQQESPAPPPVVKAEPKPGVDPEAVTRLKAQVARLNRDVEGLYRMLESR